MPDVYVKDRFVREDAAVVPVKERGFRFGDGVFETIAVHRGAPYQWAWHMQRLQKGLAAIYINYNTHALLAICRELLRRNALAQGSLRIYISRGAGGWGYDPSDDCTPLLVVETIPARPEALQPLDLWLSTLAKPSPRSLPVQYKIAQGMHATLTLLEAHEHGCPQALILGEQGMICEASSANLFWLRGDLLYTPALATGALEGSTRAAILRLSPWPVTEVEAELGELESAEAVCLSNTGFPVTAVHTLRPQGWTWQSEPLAERLCELILADREHQALAELKNINP